MALLGLNFGWISELRSNDDRYPGAGVRLIDVETLGHNVTSARGPFAGTPSRLFRHVAMAILEHGPGGYVCAVLLAPNLRFVHLPAEELTHPESFHTTSTHHRALWITRGLLPQTADAPIMGYYCVPSPSLHPDPSPTGIPGTSPARTGHGNVRSFGALVAPRPLGRSIYDPPSFPKHQPPPSTLPHQPYPASKRPLLASGPLGGFSASSVTEVYPN